MSGKMRLAETDIKTITSTFEDLKESINTMGHNGETITSEVKN